MSMGVRGKLLTGVGVSLAMLVLAALFGLGVAWQRLGGEVPPQVAQSERLSTVATDFRIQVQEWKNVLLRGADPEQLDKYWKAFEDAEGKVQSTVTALAADVADPELKQSLDTLAAEHRTLGQAYRTGLQAFRDGGFVHTVGDAAVKGVDRAATAQLAAAGERAALLANTAVADSASSSRRVIGISMGAIAVIVVLLLIGLPIWMDRAIVRPAQDAVRVADAVARGDLSVRVSHAGDDEFGRLARAMQGMVSTLQRFSRAQSEMAQAHDAGAMSARMPADEFQGSYADMANAVNTIASQLIATTTRIVEINERYARGDFSVRLEALPGEKAKISQAMDGVRGQFVAMRDEVGNLARAAARGEFSVRGDPSGFQHDFRGMVDALNTLMSTAENGIGEVGRMLRALADGDLRQRIRGEFHGMFDTLKTDANDTAERLASIIAEIRAAAEAVDTAAQEIAAGNSDLAGRTEQQAANLEETASSMEELTSTVKQNADNARHANDVARNAGGVAAQGGEVVQRVVATMGEISASSARIGDIIGVIDGIAFQTNILALNAAVEAARAGEQGRGFAVVASEVRSLAQRSADAAKEIKSLIQNSGERVDHGAALVNQAGTTMAEIVGAVRRLTDIISEIAAASSEQSSGIEQVNTTVVQMDQATQQNAALVEQASAAARTLEQQARELKRAVSAFALA